MILNVSPAVAGFLLGMIITFFGIVSTSTVGIYAMNLQGWKLERTEAEK